MVQFSELIPRIQRRIIPEPNTGCWLWDGHLMKNGYTTATVNRKSTLAHRYVYGIIKGDIPADYQIDHLCGVRCCVNPDHLEAVTVAENMRRVFIKRTHCKKGHLLSGDNLVTRIKEGYLIRECRSCRNKLSRWFSRIRYVKKKLANDKYRNFKQFQA